MELIGIFLEGHLSVFNDWNSRKNLEESIIFSFFAEFKTVDWL